MRRSGISRAGKHGNSLGNGPGAAAGYGVSRDVEGLGKPRSCPLVEPAPDTIRSRATRNLSARDACGPILRDHDRGAPWPRTASSGKISKKRSENSRSALPPCTDGEGTGAVSSSCCEGRERRRQMAASSRHDRAREPAGFGCRPARAFGPGQDADVPAAHRALSGGREIVIFDRKLDNEPSFLVSRGRAVLA